MHLEVIGNALPQFNQLYRIDITQYPIHTGRFDPSLPVQEWRVTEGKRLGLYRRMIMDFGQSTVESEKFLNKLVAGVFSRCLKESAFPTAICIALCNTIEPSNFSSSEVKLDVIRL